MGNIYPFGQCTWWCADQEPWVQRYGNLGNALDWASNWREHGGFVAMAPTRNTVACFQPGWDGADAVFGHVAVVIEVGGGKAFTVSEMNGPAGFGHTDDRVCFNGPGVSFLYENNPTPLPPPIPPKPKGDPDMWLYQLANGTIYLVQGGVLLPLGTGADAEVYIAKGVVLYNQSQFTPAYVATLAKLPVI